ncbi:MAG: hypothetical protein VZR09_10050 [Candidatus Gastranaerophilaceae bacterium]|nr:hypothetical protein [Candidatus Gastranaerophilaceae bacterium]
MKANKWYFGLFIILIIGGLIRLINLDKFGGLWYDEITIYSIASAKGFWGMLNVDSHRFLLFPLYYIIYHLWLIIFGNSDIAIRFMSCFFDIASLVCTFFVGKELAKNCVCEENKTGLIYMGLYGINSLTIYYAQEAKFYSLSLLFVNLIVLFWLKYIKNQSTKHFTLFYFANLALILAYTSQCLFVMLLYIATIIYFLKSKIQLPVKQVIIFPSVFIPVIIFALIIPQYFSGNFDAVSVDLSFILLIIQNFFSPVLNSLQNNINNYGSIFIANIFKIPFLIFVLFPITYMLYSLFKSLKKKSASNYLLIVGLSYIFIHLLLTYTTNYNVLVRYCIPVLPVFLMVCSTGISRQKKLNAFFIYILVCLIVLISPYSATKIARPDGYKQLGELLKNNNIPQSADFILPIRTNLLDKYYLIDGNRYSLYTLNNEDFQTTYLTENEINDLKSNKYSAYKRYFQSNNVSKAFENLVCENFVKNKIIVLITDKTISMYNDEQLKIIAGSNKYENFPLQFLRLSKLNNDLVSVLKKHSKQTDIIENNSWAIYVFNN